MSDSTCGSESILRWEGSIGLRWEGTIGGCGHQVDDENFFGLDDGGIVVCSTKVARRWAFTFVHRLCCELVWHISSQDVFQCFLM